LSRTARATSSAVRSFIRPFAGCEKRLIPGEGLAATTMKTGGETVCVIRNLEAEKANAARMEEILEDFVRDEGRCSALAAHASPECLDFMEAVRSAGGIASVVGGLKARSLTSRTVRSTLRIWSLR